MPFKVANVASIEVDTKRWFETNIVHPVNTRIPQYRNMPFPVDPLAHLFNPGKPRIRTIVRSTVKRFSLFSSIDADQCPCQVVVDGRRLARVPDSTYDRERLVCGHVEQVHGKTVLARGEGLGRNIALEADEPLEQGFQVK